MKFQVSPPPVHPATPKQRFGMTQNSKEEFGCPVGSLDQWLGSMGYNLHINGIDWGYSPLPHLLLTSWDIQVVAWMSYAS